MTSTRKDYTKLKHVAAVVGTIVLTALLQNTDKLFPRLFGASAFLLVPAVICCAMFENETPALFYGLLAGTLWDCAKLNFNGHAIFLCVTACAVSAIIRRKMRNTLTVAFVLSSMALFGYLLADWIFSGHSFAVIISFTLPSFIYTLVFTAVFYVIFGIIEERWRVRTLA